MEVFFGNIALVTSIIGLIPQVYKSYITRSTGDISMSMLVNYFLCSAAWIGYGICSKSDYVIYSNLVGIAVSAISIFQKRYYDSKII